MKFFLVIAAVCGCLYYAYSSFSSGGPRDAIKAGMNKLSGATEKGLNPKSASAIPYAPSLAPGVGSPVLEGIDSVAEDAMLVVRFKHREPPADTLGISTATKCILTIDNVSRSIAIVGPIDGVDICKRYLESIDQPAGSCAVKAWAVYIDKSAQSGFDLVAAIGAASGSVSTAVLGNGGLTLDLSADKLALALSVIADGSVVEVMQRPHVQLFQGVSSKIESIEEVPIPSTSVSQGISQTSIQYRKVGLQLDVTPFFLGSDRLRLAINQTNGLVGQIVKIAGNEIPIIQSQSVSTSVELSVGQTVILGGVTTYRNRIARGLLRNTKEVSEGSLYVVISTYYDVPKAVPVSAAPLPADLRDSRDWIDSQLLPSKGWQDDEREFAEGFKP